MEYHETYKQAYIEKVKEEQEKERQRESKKEKGEKPKIWKLVYIDGSEEKEELIRGAYSLCVWKRNNEESYPQESLKIIPAI